jgi:hypothetical protein
MLCGKAKMIVTRAEIIQAVNCYFFHQVRDGRLNPYATVTDVCESGNDLFEIALQGKPIEDEN